MQCNAMHEDQEAVGGGRSVPRKKEPQSNNMGEKNKKGFPWDSRKALIGCLGIANSKKATIAIPQKGNDRDP